MIARVILKYDDKSNKTYWLTADPEWLDRVPLLPGEDLNLPTRAFEIGTTIEIRGGLTKEATDTGTKEPV